MSQAYTHKYIEYTRKIAAAAKGSGSSKPAGGAKEHHKEHAKEAKEPAKDTPRSAEKEKPAVKDEPKPEVSQASSPSPMEQD